VASVSTHYSNKHTTIVGIYNIVDAQFTVAKYADRYHCSPAAAEWWQSARSLL